MRTRWQGIALLMVLAGLLQGCAVGRLDESLARGVMDNDDLGVVENGLPAYLLMVDGLIVNWPQREGLLSTGADLYAAYAGLFVHDEQRAARLSDKALGYALRAACAHDSDYCDLRDLPVPEFEALIDEAGRGEVPVLFTLGSAWAGYIETHSGDWNAVAELSQVRALMERVVAIDEGYRYGQAQMYLGVLDSLLPATLGGKPEQARRHFERAIALSQGRNLLARVLYAQHYARLVFDRELHDRQLRLVLAADPEEPGLTLQNTHAQREAKRLLASADEYF
ncbi:TRAP transporter TatT component family protein [Alloalcanivorax mobilis]|uniref:TRAP transporter TatT component family protein n=1 Tax=Alloalcanivorax mobilis TaxID=2019569 RepID=UPI001E313F14|nr:TRAP transporter TatT component family protein [Alloalcanivorax mobilis]